MTALVACETVLLVLLSILVVGLLRSHAEILRRLGRPEADEGEALPPASAADSGARAADDVAGVTPAGDAIQVGLGPGAPTTLLAFLGSGCSSCHELWEGLAPERRDLPGDLRVVVVAQDPSRESPSRLRRLSPPDLPVVMSSAAWEHYGVPGSPYFVLVDGPSGRVSGEGAAVGWPELTSLLRDARADAAAGADDGTGASGAERARRAERTLARAGIGPGHPSLYPSPSAEDPEGGA